MKENQMFKCYTNGKPDVLTINKIIPATKEYPERIYATRKRGDYSSVITRRQICELVTKESHPELFL